MIYISHGAPAEVSTSGGDIEVNLRPTTEDRVTIEHDTFTEGLVTATYSSSDGKWTILDPRGAEAVIPGASTPASLLRVISDLVVFPEDLGKIEGPVDPYITEGTLRNWFTSESRFEGFDADKIFVDLLTEPGPIFARGQIFHGEVAVVFNGRVSHPRWAVTNSVHRPTSVPQESIPPRIREMIEVEMIDRRTRRD